MSVFCLGSVEIDRHWNEIAPHLHRLQRLGFIDTGEVREDLKAARKQLWGYEDCGRVVGVAITRVTKSRVCEIYGAAGTTTAPQQIQQVHEAIEAWAKSINCTKLRLQGRRGWLRKLTGYTQTGIIAEKEF